MKTFHIIIETAKAYYDELFILCIMGTVSVLSCILILPAPFAFGGLWAAGQRAARGYGIKWEHYWQGVKEYGWRNLILTLVLILGYSIVFTNLWFYNNPDISPLPPHISQWITPFWIALLVLWTGVTFYANAFLVELEEPKLLIILRNSLFLSLRHPFPTLTLIILTLLILGISILLPVLLFITPPLILILRLTAARMLIQADVATLAEKDNVPDADEE